MKSPPIPPEPPPTVDHHVPQNDILTPQHITPHVLQVSTISPQLQYDTTNHTWHTTSSPDDSDEPLLQRIHTVRAIKAIHPNDKITIFPQSDTGANISITNDRTIIQEYSNIYPFAITHASDSGPLIMAIA